MILSLVILRMFLLDFKSCILKGLIVVFVVRYLIMEFKLSCLVMGIVMMVVDRKIIVLVKRGGVFLVVI